MKTRHWNLVTLVGIVLIAGGLLLAQTQSLAGKMALLAGCILFVISIIGSTRHDRKTLRCPHCGVKLTPIGRRYGGGVFGLHGLDSIPCPECGALISSWELSQQE